MLAVVVSLRHIRLKKVMENIHLWAKVVLVAVLLKDVFMLGCAIYERENIFF